MPTFAKAMQEMRAEGRDEFYIQNMRVRWLSNLLQRKQKVYERLICRNIGKDHILDLFRQWHALYIGTMILARSLAYVP